jgi:DNA invertase Pin-like site-specific DNA recombinase
MTIALYARVSTRNKQDTENQLRQLRSYARKQRWRITAEYVDKESGASADRPRFKQMFEDARQRKFDLVLFWSLDRLSREGVLETLNHLQRLTSYGVNWRSHTEEYLDSCGVFKDAVLSILATIAKQERVRLSERVKAGLERARSKGKALGRRPLVFRRDQVPVLRKQGLSLRQIAAKLGCSKQTVVNVLTQRAPGSL